MESSGEQASNLSVKARSLWAKVSDQRGSSDWLSLPTHMSDSCMVCREIWNDWVSPAVKSIIVRGISMSDGSDVSLETAEGLVFFLAAAHDLGKASPAFQCKIIPSNLDIQEECRQRLAGSGLELNLNLSQSHSPKHAIISEMILERNGIDRTVGVVLGGHHGKPPGFTDLENLSAYSGHTGSKSKSWVDVQDELLGFACQLSSFDLGIVRKIRLDLQSQAVLTGLVIMSDWMASDEILFPYSEDGVGQSASERIGDVWSSIGIRRWDAEDEWSSYDLYEGRFGFTARPFQRAVADVAANVSGPCMIVIEAPMGEGKTEAALVAAETLASRFGDGGVIFALPTQATADGIFRRFLDWAEKASPGFDHHSIFLAHGKSRFNDEFNRLRSSNMRVGDEDGGLVSGNIVAMDWFSGRKKGLLSDFVVGTVDQVLMAGLKQRHLALRHLALSGKVVVIDECHAYDAYMGSYLSLVLRWLGSYRVPVILMSATLPSGTRRMLMESYSNTGVDKTEEESTAYPRISVVDGNETSYVSPGSSSRRYDVRIERITDSEMTDKLHTFLQDGGCAGVIVNTVSRAQGFYEELKSEYPDDRVILIHSAFTGMDRSAIESDVMDALQEAHSTQQIRTIVVGTQVLEQSLDIDFDLLVSDICPMDLLIQRIGRLHRHDNPRPPRMAVATCLVLDTDGGEFEKGSEAVYGRFHLMNARLLLPESLNIPDDIPRLVESAYDPSGVQWGTEIFEDYLDAKRDDGDLISIERRKARAFQICRPDRSPEDDGSLVGWLDMALSDKTERMAECTVRDADPSVEVILVCRDRMGNFRTLPWAGESGGSIIPSDSCPDAGLAYAMAGCKIRLPGRLTRRYNIERTINQLENIIKQNVIPQVWQESYWLAGELFLPLDEDLTATFEGLRMRYDREYGMRVCDDRERIQPDPREVDTGDERGWDDRGGGSAGCAGPCSRVSPHIKRTPDIGLCSDEASDGNGLCIQSRMAGRDR